MHILYYLASFLCHQSPSRTLALYGKLLPLCARCTGIYSGFFLGLGYQIILGNRKSKQLPISPVSLASIALILLLAIDGIVERFGFASTGNIARLLFGLLCGFSLSLFILPLFNRFALKTPVDSPVIEGWKMYLYGLALISFFFASQFLRNYVIFYLWSWMSFAGVIVSHIMINIMLSTAIIGWSSGTDTTRSKLLLSGSIILLLTMEIYILRLTHPH